MLYTRGGDDGTTGTFGAGGRISKSSLQAEALGALDEINSFLGLVKVKTAEVEWTVAGKNASDILLWIQNALFTIQAEVAGAGKSIDAGMVAELERLTDAIEKEMPPIKTFFVSGGTEAAALFDISRTMARKAERRVIRLFEHKKISVSVQTLAFLNRLSSLLYALARFINFKAGLSEKTPWYN